MPDTDLGRIRAVIVLQARMGSSRLPGKVLEPLGERCVLEWCVRRLTAARVGPLVLATTALERDDPIAQLALAWGVEVVRGPEDDVLARFALAVAGRSEAFVVRATADNPFVDTAGPARVLERLAAGADYATEVGLPVGAAVEGVRRDALIQAAAEARDSYEREHVTPFIWRRTSRFRVERPAAPAVLAAPGLRLTVDTPDDLARARSLAQGLGFAVGTSLASIIEAARRLGIETETA